MKTSIFTAFFTLTLCLPAYAWQDICTDMSREAGAIMTARQAEAPMHKVMTWAVEGGDNITEEIVIDAFNHPLVDGLQEKLLISEFENRWYGICVEIFR